MPRQAKQAGQIDTLRTLVVDNGGHSIKAGFANSQPDSTRDCSLFPNCIARSSEGGRGGNTIYVADQVESCKDTGEMAFRRPVEKGYIVNWDSQMDIWKQTLFNPGTKLHCDPHDTNLILSEAPNCPLTLQTNTDQIIFEELEFASAYRCLGSTLNAWNDIPSLIGDDATGTTPVDCILLVDSGYSQTTVTPLIRGRAVPSAVRRLDVGGRTLTNFLKELASLRHWNLMDDSYLVSQIKEDTCFVSQNFDADLRKVWDLKAPKQRAQAVEAGVVSEYVLPDYKTSFRGHLKAGLSTMSPDETSLPLGNERFAVPELLFRPSDIASTQAGLPESIVQSLSCLPRAIWAGLLANVVVVGGTAKLPGFIERLKTELRTLTPGDCVLRVTSPDDPLTYTWLGGAHLAREKDQLKKICITKEDYHEHGAAWTQRKFASDFR